MSYTLHSILLDPAQEPDSNLTYLAFRSTFLSFPNSPFPLDHQKSRRNMSCDFIQIELNSQINQLFSENRQIYLSFLHFSYLRYKIAIIKVLTSVSLVGKIKQDKVST